MNAPSNNAKPIAATGRRILSLWFPYLSTERIWRRRLGRGWRSACSDFPPLVVSRQDNNTRRIFALDQHAKSLNLRQGMGLADALAMYAKLDVIEADVQADRRLLEGLADWCDRYTPLVSLDGADGLFLDVTGCSHLFGGEKLLLEEILSRLQGQGFEAHGAIAATAGTAWAVARFSNSAIVPDGEEADWLAALPLQALRLEEETCALLAGVGLRTAGAIMAAPRPPLTRRFGKTLLLRLDQALGRLEESLSPRMPVPELSAERRLAEPVVRVEDIERVICLLAEALREPLEQREAGALALQLLLFRVDGVVSRLSVGLSRPTRAPAWIGKLFQEKFATLEDGVDTGYGFDLIRLCVLSSAPLAARQTDMEEKGGAEDDDLALFVDRVAARFGRETIRQPVPIASHLPERALALAAFGTDEGNVREALPPRQDQRPLRLLFRPEPVDVMAEVPEGPPLNFRWRRAQYRIARAEGPERLSPEWWRETLPFVERKDGEKEDAYERRRKQAAESRAARLTRDYFRVEDDDGRHFWLYRQGLYGKSQATPRWFLHGIFA